MHTIRTGTNYTIHNTITAGIPGTRYTRDTLSVYMDTHSVDACFAPVHHVSMGEHIHKCTAQHLTLFRQISGVGDMTLQEALQLDYTNLLLAYMQLYHMMPMTCSRQPLARCSQNC